jgi:hypothetical protein
MFAKRQLAAHLKSGSLKHPQHRPVGEQDLGVEPRDPTLRRDLGELLEHPGRGAATLKIIGHCKRDLSRSHFAQPVKARHRHHPTIVPRHQRTPVRATSLHDRPRSDIRARIPVKPHEPALRRQAVEEARDVIKIGRRRSLQAQSGPITQQHVPNYRHRLTSRGEHHRPPRGRPMVPPATIVIRRINAAKIVASCGHGRGCSRGLASCRYRPPRAVAQPRGPVLVVGNVWWRLVDCEPV